MRAHPQRGSALARFCIGAAIAALVVEVLARLLMGNLAIAHLYEVTDDCVRLKANARVEYTGWFLRIDPVTQDTNSMRYRGAEYPYERSTRQRLAVIGDSMVYGQGVAADQTMPAFLGDILDAEVMNFGMPALSITDFTWQYDFARRWSPGAVLAVVTENDLDPSICDSVPTHLNFHIFYAYRLVLMVSVITRIVYRGIVDDEPALGLRAEELARNLHALKRRVEGDGGVMALLFLGDPISPLGSKEHDVTKDTLNTLGIPWLDGRTWRKDGLPTIPGEFHLTPEGNRIVAQRIAAWVRNRNFGAPAAVSAAPEIVEF